MVKPTNLAEWGTGSAPIVEPTLVQKQNGWTSAFKPPAQWFNWWMNVIYTWIVWLDAFESTAHTWSVAQTFAGLTSTGIGGNNGGNFVGGSGGGDGIHAFGTAGGYGAVFQGSASGGYGVSAVGGAGSPGAYGQGGTNADGTVGLGNGTGVGGRFTGGATGDGVVGVSSAAAGGTFTGGGTGNGVDGVGGASDGAGVTGEGGGNGNGGNFFGSGTGYALLLSHLTGLVAKAHFLGAQPASSDAFSNTITKLSIIKAWGLVIAGTAPSLPVGFNVTGVALTGVAPKSIRVTMASAMSGTNYIVVVFPCNVGNTTPSTNVCSAYNMSTTTFDFGAVTSQTGVQVDLGLGTPGATYGFIVLGAQ